MSSLAALLAYVSNALLAPDLVAAIALLGLVLVEAGILAAQLVGRRRARAALAPILRDALSLDETTRRAALERYLTIDPIPAGAAFALAVLGGRARLAPARAYAIENAHLQVEARLARLTWCIRLGPMVGLVGTLIPLGPGLTALAQGDIAKLASHLTVAFAVTVVGLATGALGFVLASVRRGVEQRDLADLTLLADTLEALEQPS